MGRKEGVGVMMMGNLNQVEQDESDESDRQDGEGRLDGDPR